jgi:glutamate-ammonia-ligase adenylyltransferase
MGVLKRGPLDDSRGAPFWCIITLTMNPDIKTLKTIRSETDQRFLVEHLTRLGERYFKIFSEEDQQRHLASLSRLTSRHPVQVLLDRRKDGTVDCTVLAFDYPAEFSIITGILSGMGFDIVSGEVFTYEGVPEKTHRLTRRSRKLREEASLLKRRKIIDHFSGTVDTPMSYEAWGAEMKARMEALIGLLERGDESSVSDAKHQVNEMVIDRLARLKKPSSHLLYPVEMEVDNAGGNFTRLKVVSQDTPAFLYALSNALSLHRLSIEHVKIRTIRSRIEDEIDLVDLQGKKIEDPDLLNRVKLSVLLTKQFTYFLGEAPDPFSALSRFEQLVDEVLSKPRQGQWLELLANPRGLQDLARLLGASEFLWEDFICLQYETLLPLLGPYVHGSQFAEPSGTVKTRIEEALKGASTLEEQGERLNAFKDREIFVIDLDQILSGRSDFQLFAERLTELAENVVAAAARLVYEDLAAQYGRPRSVAGLEAKYAVLGLGKLGGAALGYASDLELLFVFSDSGRTDGKRRLENAEFFDLLVKGVTRLIRAKREGIFHLDLRLRPYGNAGPLACSLESFCRYYGLDGAALSYERLALVRMRAIAGDLDLGKQLERLRDEMVYFQGKINLEELRELREKQFTEKTEGGKLNAKFSPGGLVDLEYSVQILQVRHGKDYPALRTPLVHKALNALGEADVLSPDEASRLTASYGFLRRLINSMRMLRGSARDLFLPAIGSDEFAHLARRMGYETARPLDPQEQLRIDFENHTAKVRMFIERYFGRESLPGTGAGSVADLILSDQIPMADGYRILRNAGIKNAIRAYANLRGLAGRGVRTETFAKLSLLAFDILSRKPDPDMALNNWERFIHSLGSPEFHYHLLLSQPMRLDILLSIFSGSQFLSDTLVRNPGFLDWTVIPEVLHRMRELRDMEEELRKAASTSSTHAEWLNKLRRLRRREILRIGTRDMYLKVGTRDVMTELSRLAEAFTKVVLEKAFERLEQLRGRGEDVESRFCILALGKLGGNELNYSSDIDLLGLWDDRGTEGEGRKWRENGLGVLYARVMEEVSADLSRHTEEGHAYRVDLRLRPFGREGELVSSFSGLEDYYRQKASLWEIQAALKMRPVAGNERLGYDLIGRIQPALLKTRSRATIVDSIEKMRAGAIKTSSMSLGATMDVKSGIGGLRDVEFLVQGLQLIHAPKHPSLLEGNTARALELFRQAGIIPEAVVSTLQKDYLFLRQVEHYLQILEDRQIHSIPRDREELNALGKRILGMESSADKFMEVLQVCLSNVRAAYVTYLIEAHDISPRNEAAH